MAANNTTVPNFDMVYSFRVMRLVLYPLTILIGIIGNVLVTLIIIFNRPRDLRPSVRYFILNLAVSDFIVLIMFIPFDLAYMEMGEWIFGEILCKAVNTLNYTFVTVSGTTLAAISLERHRSIVYPIKKPLNRRYSKLIIVVIWIYAVLTLVPFIDSLHVTADRECLNDVSWWPSQLAFQMTFLFSCIVPGCILPLTCIAVCYISIGVSLNKQSKRPTFRHTYRTRQNGKTVKVLTALVVVYAICILPHYIVISMYIFIPGKTSKLPFIDELHEFTRLMMTANSCLNPIMYSAVSKEFRDRLKYICCGRRFTMDINPADVAAIRMRYLQNHH